MNILLDIDDTIAQTLARGIEHINSHTDKRYSFSEMTQTFREGKNLEFDKLFQSFIHNPKLVASISPYEDALLALERLHSAQHNIHIVSSRKEPIHETTLHWLKDHGFHDYISHVHPRFSDESGRDYKVRTALENDLRVAFDDTYDVAKSLADAGIKVYLIDKPWNHGAPSHKNIQRAASFAAATDDFLASHQDQY